MKKAPASRLAELEAARTQYGAGCATRIEKLLTAIERTELSDAASLIRFHDALLFLRAFPHSRKVILLTEKLLDGMGQRVQALRDSGADMELFDAEEFSGIAGTAIDDDFTYEVARWLASRYPQHLRVNWDLDEQGRQMSSSLPQLVPLLADDCLVEADTPYLTWLGRAAGGEERILPWLLQQLEAMPLDMLRKTAWYDALKINIAWSLGESRASRTRARCSPPDNLLPRRPADSAQSGIAGRRVQIRAIAPPQTLTQATARRF